MRHLLTLPSLASELAFPLSAFKQTLLSLRNDLLTLTCVSLCTAFLFPTLLIADGPSQSSNENEQSRTGMYLGTATCSSSNCHGNTAPRKNSNVRQDEYVTWFRHGSHSQAYQSLGNADSQKIAEHLGISSPQNDPLCLSCHATYVPDSASRGEKFQIEDGVSCESCHGPAGGWVSTHTQVGADHAQNVKNGMRDIFQLEDRARLCLSCHYGTEDKTVNHRLIGAGHPRLSFELDTFSMIQPRHWDIDEDYIERKGNYNSASAWLVGQAMISSETIAALLSEKRSQNGLWPELSLFTCYSCHHNLTSDQWKVRSYELGPGELRYNVSSLRMLKEALVVLSPENGILLDKLLSGLHHAQKTGDGKSHLLELRTLLDSKLVPFTKTTSLTNSDLRKLLKQMVGIAAKNYHYQYEEAEQITMAVASILATLKESDYKSDLDAMYEAVKNPEDFNANKFMTSARTFNKKL